MIKFFRNSTPTLLGIDVSSSTVKLLELQKLNNTYRVESYAIIPLPIDAVIEKVIKDEEGLAETIRKAVTKSKTTAKHAAIAVTDSSVITKIVQMDASLHEEDIESQIAIEADKYVPYPLEEVSLDFDVLGPTAKNPELNDILLAASRSENVNSWTHVVDEAGLTVKVVDVESYAVERACSLVFDSVADTGEEETIAVIDIGAAVTNLTVLYNMSTIFTREEVFGGTQLTKAIQRHYGLSYAEAGLAKKEGGLPDDYVTEILTPFKESAVLQVRRALQFFFSASQHNKISHILLAGGTANIPGLAKQIEEQIGIPTTIANPFAKMQISKRVDAMALKRDASALMIGCGLALRSFDEQG